MNVHGLVLLLWVLRSAERLYEAAPINALASASISSG
ncbi:hypothetical protein RCH23_003435 [Cryobacterium sp. CAN_C3]|nr:hypothetical protein [Cryobacterium sp. CAN_C3]